MKRKKSTAKTVYYILGSIFMLASILVLILFATGVIKFPMIGQNVVKDTRIIEILNNQQQGSCSITVNPSVINPGDLVTMTIVASPNDFCEVYGEHDGVWLEIGEGSLGSTGVASVSEEIFLEGDFSFRAICGDCVTNTASLTVNTVPVGDCSDSDGTNKMTPGHVTSGGISYYDDCVGNSVKEFYCLDGSVASETLPCDLGYTCFETRSGDYCQLDAGDGVGDDVGGGTGGSGGGTFGDDIITDNIFIDWTPGGSFILGARITRSWSYTDPQCEPALPQQYPMEWTFYDSNGMAWQKYDYTPVSGAVDTVCPVTYHPDAPWKFTVSVGIQDCDVDYSWNLQPYICEEV